MLHFASGMVTMGFLIAGLFFLRFWRRTRDRLFATFAGAFWLLAANAGIVSLIDAPREELSWVYLLRIAAFSLIIYAVISKNVGARGPGRNKDRR